MFCGKCGEQMAENAKYCGKCGTSNQSSAKGISKTEINPVAPPHQASPIFYSEDWTQRKAFALVDYPYFDIMVDQDYLYIIRLGKFHWGLLGTIAGLLVLSLLGAVIGYYFGSKNDKEKRRLLREAWISTDCHLISDAYERYLFLKIPIQNVKNFVSSEKHKLIIKHNVETIILAKKMEEVDQFNKFINKYVL